MTDAAISWTDERVEQLKKLWGDGLSASQIAAEIGGVSRNAVIGKVHRLGLSGRAKPGAQPQGAARGGVRPKPGPTPVRSPGLGTPILHADTDGTPAEAETRSASAAPVAEPAPAVPFTPIAAAVALAAPREIAVPVSERVTIMELRESMCRWPLGDPTTPDFRYCGGRSITGLPYCTHHAQVAYQPAADRRRDRRYAAG